MGAAIIIDDADPKLKSSYVGTQWGLQPGSGDSLLNGTLTACQLDKKTTSSVVTAPYLQYTFYGSDFSLYGPGLAGVALNYTIDGTSVRPATDFNSSASTTLKSGVKLWSLTGLDSTSHNLKMFPASGQFAFDYMTYTPSRFASLTGAQIIVDDGDSLLKYSGNNNWAKLSNQVFGTGMPYLNTLSSSKQKGSTMKFDFTGSSITVYGALNQQSGTLSAQFSVDSGTPLTFTPFDGSQAVDPSTWKINQKLFYKDLVPGQHSLQVTLSDVSGSQALYIDSVVFEGTSGTTLASLNNPTATGSPAGNAISSIFSAAKIGGIIGAAIVFTFITACLVICLRRRRVRPNPQHTLLVVQTPMKPTAPVHNPPVFRPAMPRNESSGWSSAPTMTMPTPIRDHNGTGDGAGSRPPAVNSLIGLMSTRSPADATSAAQSPSPPRNPAHNMDGFDNAPAPTAERRHNESGDGAASIPPPYRERTSTETLD